MKIVLKDKVYVQKNDLSYLMNAMEGKAIPSSIINKVFGEIFICCDDNRYEFVEFTEPEEIEFFKALSYSVDYMYVKDLTEEDLIDVGSSIIEQRNAIALKYNSMTPEEREAHNDLRIECDLLEFKMLSIRDMVWLKQGHIKMKFPRDVKGMEEKKGIKGLFSKFRR